jgi:hypothetical protein
VVQPGSKVPGGEGHLRFRPELAGIRSQRRGADAVLPAREYAPGNPPTPTDSRVEARWQPIGMPYTIFYDAPFTLPLARRNEAAVAVAESL